MLATSRSDRFKSVGFIPTGDQAPMKRLVNGVFCGKLAIAVAGQ
jgi:hypothetical protein